MEKLLPDSCSDEQLHQIAVEVADALPGGESSRLFRIFACLVEKDPAARLTAAQLQHWLQQEAAPQDRRRHLSQSQGQRHSQLAEDLRSEVPMSVCPLQRVRSQVPMSERARPLQRVRSAPVEYKRAEEGCQSNLMLDDESEFSGL